MHIDEFEISSAEGIILLNSIRFDDIFLPQGHKITHSDITLLKSLGIKKITGIKTENDDINASLALGIIAPQICGNNLGYAIAKNSQTCKIVAATDGTFICNEQRLAKFNKMAPYLILNTVSPYKNVKKNDIIGSLKLCCPVVEQNFLDDITFKLSANEPLLSITPSATVNAAVIISQFTRDNAEKRHAVAVIQRLQKNFSDLHFKFEKKLFCLHEFDDTSACISEACRKYPFVFIVPALPSSCITDTIPSALSAATDKIFCKSIPLDNLPDLMIAQKKESKIISLPYHYDKDISVLADQMIKIALTKHDITNDDFNFIGNAPLDISTLSPGEQKNLLIPKQKNKTSATVAAVILAAGCSTRARRNKLLVKINDEPLFMKAVRAAIKSKAYPVYVITGHHAEDIEEYLKDFDINILRNEDYASGVKTSIKLGLESVPSFCQGAILIPADMPFVTAQHINKMIKAFSPTQERQVCISACEGQKYNPILFSRSLYAKADLVPENASLREIFLEFRDYTTLIETEKSTCFDVNFPYDIEVLNNKSTD